MNYFLPRLNEQFGVTDHFLAVNSVHGVSGTDVRIHHPVVDGAVLLLRRHLVPGRAMFSFDPLPLLHYLLCHGVDGGKVLKLLLFHTVAVEARHGRGGHLWLQSPAVVIVGWEEEAAGGASSVGNTALLWLNIEWLKTLLFY